MTFVNFRILPAGQTSHSREAHHWTQYVARVTIRLMFEFCYVQAQRYIRNYLVTTALNHTGARVSATNSAF